MRIGLLEDDESLIKIMSLWLESAGNSVQAYINGKDFRKGLANEKYDLLVLDWFLPDTNGLDELDWLRSERDNPIPVIFMTTNDDEKSVVTALNHGADDYLVKPVNREVILARINALHRRYQLNATAGLGLDAAIKTAESEGVEDYDPYKIDYAKRSIAINGLEVKLTNKEFELASFMFRHAASLITRETLLEWIWGTKADLNTRTVDTHISRIRSKLGINTDIGWQLNSIYQCGYRLSRVH